MTGIGFGAQSFCARGRAEWKVCKEKILHTVGGVNDWELEDWRLFFAGLQTKLNAANSI